MEGYIAVVTCFAGNFAPRNWAYCNGQILSIAQNTALFSLLGTTYGGNGQTTFGLPNLQGRTQVSPGNGAGLPSYVLGEIAGSETVVLTPNNLPSHTHDGATTFKLQADNSNADSQDADFCYPSLFPGEYNSSPATGVTMTPPVYSGTIAVAGGSQPFSILDPYLVVNYIICMYGIFPSRN